MAFLVLKLNISQKSIAHNSRFTIRTLAGRLEEWQYCPSATYGIFCNHHLLLYRGLTTTTQQQIDDDEIKNLILIAIRISSITTTIHTLLKNNIKNNVTIYYNLLPVMYNSKNFVS